MLRNDEEDDENRETTSGGKPKTAREPVGTRRTSRKPPSASGSTGAGVTLPVILCGPAPAAPRHCKSPSAPPQSGRDWNGSHEEYLYNSERGRVINVTIKVTLATYATQKTLIGSSYRALFYFQGQPFYMIAIKVEPPSA